MAEIHFENRDCVEAMKEFPDNFFDLAIVDPPYGDGSQTVNVERERAYNRFGGRFDRYKDLSGGWHGKQKYHLGTPSAQEQPTTGRNMGLSEVAVNWRRSMQKNYFVGCRAEARIF